MTCWKWWTSSAHLWAMGCFPTDSTAKTKSRIITIGLYQLPRQWTAARTPSSPPVYYLACFAPFAEEDGDRAANSRDRWQSVCLFSTSLLLRGVPTRRDRYSATVLPPLLIQQDCTQPRLQPLFASSPVSQVQAVWNVFKTQPSCLLFIRFCVRSSEHLKVWARSMLIEVI